MRKAWRSLLLTLGLSGFLLSILEVSALANAPSTRTSEPAEQKAENDRLLKQCREDLHHDLDQEATQSCFQAAEKAQNLKNALARAKALNNLGVAYRGLGLYEKAILHSKESLQISQRLGNLLEQARTLRIIGYIHHDLEDYVQAANFYNASLEKSRASGERLEEAFSLVALGQLTGQNSEDKRSAIVLFLDAFEIVEELNSFQGKIAVLDSLGILHKEIGEYDKSISFHEKSLSIKRKANDFLGESDSLIYLGNTYEEMGRYSNAIRLFEKSLEYAKSQDNLPKSARALGNLSALHWVIGNYTEALNYIENSLALAQKSKSDLEFAVSLGRKAIVLHRLGQYQQAQNFYQASLDIYRQREDERREAITLGNIGSVYLRLRDTENAISAFRKSLEINEKLGNLRGKATALGNLGRIYNDKGEHKRALYFYEKSLATRYRAQDIRGSAYSLLGIGSTYGNLGNHKQRIAYAQRALPILRDYKLREHEGAALSGIGFSFEILEKQEIAIIFYKSAIDIYESIRSNIQDLSLDLQQSYTDTIADEYRALADLLLQQNRIPEAQRVLDLLKVQELDDYFQGVQRNADTQTGIAYRQPEQNILDLYIDTVLAAEELKQLSSRPPKDLNQSERQRLKQLNAQKGQLSTDFNQFLDSPEVTTALAQLRDNSQGQSLEPEQFKQLKNNLAKLPQSSALLYPLILPDRLELVLVLPNAEPVRVPVQLEAHELNKAIVEFGQALSNPGSDPQPQAQQLYQWLIKPLEPALAAAKVTNLVYAPDGALRYIPLAALHSGNGSEPGQWMAERYSITNITAASLTDFDSQPSGDLRLFAGACAECSFEFDVNGQPYRFSDLPATQTEVQALAESFEDNTVLLNQAFSPEELELNLGYYNVLHLATHAAFVEGDPKESFIVFGNGSRTSLRQIRENWDLSKQELIVLSACQTAVGSAQLGDGSEILGLGYQMQASGAQAALSSLWQVNDSGTQQLMNAFYDELLQGDGKTKSQALQQAQRLLIGSDRKVAGGDRASLVVAGGNRHRGKGAGLSHPYYWAPFILIGNGL